MKNILLNVFFIVILLFGSNLPISAQQPVSSDSSFKQGIKYKQDIQQLINAYGHDADRRLAQEQANLFTEDGAIENYRIDRSGNKPDTILKGRSSLLNGFGILKKYDITMHFIGQTTIEVNGDSATGEVYCLAHHFWKENGKRMLMVIGIRYYDTYVRQNNKWLFAKRKLIYDWIDKRPSSE